MKIKKLKVSLQEKCLVDIHFTINKSLALVGQSGSGKSLTLKALLGMLPESMHCTLERKIYVLRLRLHFMADRSVTFR